MKCFPRSTLFTVCAGNSRPLQWPSSATPVTLANCHPLEQYGRRFSPEMYRSPVRTVHHPRSQQQHRSPHLARPRPKNPSYWAVRLPCSCRRLFSLHKNAAGFLLDRRTRVETGSSPPPCSRSDSPNSHEINVHVFWICKSEIEIVALFSCRQRQH